MICRILLAQLEAKMQNESDHLDLFSSVSLRTTITSLRKSPKKTKCLKQHLKLGEINKNACVIQSM